MTMASFQIQSTAFVSLPGVKFSGDLGFFGDNASKLTAAVLNKGMSEVKSAAGEASNFT